MVSPFGGPRKEAVVFHVRDSTARSLHHLHCTVVKPPCDPETEERLHLPELRGQGAVRCFQHAYEGPLRAIILREIFLHIVKKSKQQTGVKKSTLRSELSLLSDKCITRCRDGIQTHSSNFACSEQLSMKQITCMLLLLFLPWSIHSAVLSNLTYSTVSSHEFISASENPRAEVSCTDSHLALRWLFNCVLTVFRLCVLQCIEYHDRGTSPIPS